MRRSKASAGPCDGADDVRRGPRERASTGSRSGSRGSRPGWSSTATGRSSRPGPRRGTGRRELPRSAPRDPDRDQGHHRRRGPARQRRASSPGPSGSPTRDAAIVARLREAGAVILGKTVTTQFAWIDPPATRNPWNLDRTPGGSSSGSAAAVAVRHVPGGDRHPDGRLDHPPGVVLRRRRAQADHGDTSERRRDRPFAPSLDHPGPDRPDRP